MIADAFLQQLLLGLAPPVAAAAGVLGVAVVWDRGRRACGDGAAALALATSLLAGLVALDAWPRLPPASGTQAAVVAVVAASLVAAADGWRRWPRGVWAVVVVLLAALGSVLVLMRVLSHWTVPRLSGYVAAGVVLTGAAALAWRAAARRAPVLVATHVAAVAAGSGAVLSSGSALLGQLAGALAAGAAVVALASLWLPAARPRRGATVVAALAVALLAVCGVAFADVEIAAVAWLGVAPLAALAVRPLRAPVVRWLVVLGVTGGFLSMAVATAPQNPYAGY